jgi:putative transcriptional regulator
MMDITNFENLQGNFLIASPIVTDIRFKQKIIFLTEVRQLQAFGFIIGDEFAGANLKKQLKGTKFENEEIFYGGPVSETQLFIIHSNEVACKESLKVTSSIYVTNFNDAIKNPEFKLPKEFKILAGFTQWKNMQLHKEIGLSYWIVEEFNHSTLFYEKNNWNFCMKKNNISSFNFSLFSGAC